MRARLVGENGGKLISRADSVGEALRLRRLADRADVDTSELSATQQRVLRGYLRSGGEDAADRYRAASRSQRDALTLGGLCGGTSGTATTADTDCLLSEYPDAAEELGAELAESSIRSETLRDDLASLTAAQRETVVKFAAEDHDGVDRPGTVRAAVRHAL